MRPRSRDLGVPFSIANRGDVARGQVVGLDAPADDAMKPLLKAVLQATEEATVNVLVAAETGTSVHGIPHDRQAGLMARRRAELS